MRTSSKLLLFYQKNIDKMSWLSQDLGTELFILYNGTRIRVSTEQALSKKQYVALFFGANVGNKLDF